MPNHNHRLVSGALQVGHSPQKVHGALKHVVWMSVIQPERGDALANKFLRHSGVGARSRPTKTASCATDPDYCLVSVRGAMQYGVEVPSAGFEPQSFTDIAVGEIDSRDIFDAHQLFS